ncbi:hypothetical protein [Spirilliplanes yamanashiensis]|uniref:hypothetical protein n=1 Tax=Spirilliplanes yamanashiensis TaxID=42233 RepID=UPI001EF2AF7B|nr:hypothetical protein [Spirilliplanes yamanashiensis]MDP9814226.1 hypothetical protein [Spirilliplanes yamanashiensis]
MSVTDAGRAELHVTCDGVRYRAEAVGRGAAYELFADAAAPGFTPDRRPDARAAYHRFVHATEPAAVDGPEPPTADDAPLTALLSRGRGWTQLHRHAQSAAHRDDAGLHAVRATAAVRRGTQMVKVLSPAQFAGHLSGWLPYGFCYRAYDVAHLRTPADLLPLRTDTPSEPGAAAYALRWRATDPVDYEIPMGAVQRGLPGLPPHGRVGPPVLGTGFSPSDRHLVPEFVTAGVVDLPLSANAQLVAYTPDGDEVVLYAYQPEQRGWLRLAGPRWRHLLAGVPGVNADQEYVPTGDAARASRLVGWIGATAYEAVADPPEDFRVLAMTRAARYPVEALVRRFVAARWRGVPCSVLREESGWLRLRLAAPDADSVALLGARCYERGVYEVWAPAAEVTDHGAVDVAYRL